MDKKRIYNNTQFEILWYHLLPSESLDCPKLAFMSKLFTTKYIYRTNIVLFHTLWFVRIAVNFLFASVNVFSNLIVRLLQIGKKTDMFISYLRLSKHFQILF